MWLVCKEYDGSLFIQERIERELTLFLLFSLGQIVSSYVVKCFDNRNEAKKYMENLLTADKIINKAIQ